MINVSKQNLLDNQDINKFLDLEVIYTEALISHEIFSLKCINWLIDRLTIYVYLQ